MIIKKSSWIICNDGKTKESILNDILQIITKISSFDTPTNFNPHDSKSFLNTFDKQNNEILAEIQSHYPIDIYNVTLDKFYEFKKIVEQKMSSKTNQADHPLI